MVEKNKLEKASAKEAASKLDVDVEKGLTSKEAESRLEKYGPNTIEEESKNPLLKFLSYFWGPIPWMLEVATILSAVGSRWEEFFVVLTMLIINGVVSWWHEKSAEDAIEALKSQIEPKANVIRDGKKTTVDAKELVPGDILILHRGNVVPADATIVSDEISLDESSLTGESLPVDKGKDKPVYTGTSVKRGETHAIVTATGKSTRFAKTVELVAGADQKSHFQKAVLKIGYFLMAATAVLIAVVVIFELSRGHSWLDVLIFALILTVAGIPVALPAVLSVTMAVGARKLAKKKAIVSKLSAMEELAGVKILFSDKTGTLTLNKLKLQDPVLFETKDEQELKMTAALTTDRGDDRDPIDAAILSDTDEKELDKYNVKDFQPFDSSRKRSEAEVERDGETFSAAKGAPQVLLDLCEADSDLRDKVNKEIDRLGDNGFRALGVAKKVGDKSWKYLGLLSLLDPPREDSAEVIKNAKEEGIDVRMVTGDHEAIGRQVAKQVGMGTRIEKAGDWLKSEDKDDVQRAIDAQGFAEVTPEDKYHIVETFQEKGNIVAMTGDGVNDAPALKKADVGFAVSGATDATRAASDIVLTRPGLGVIISAVEEARRIFERMLSYTTFRITETIRMVVFIALTIVLLNIYPVTAIMVALLAILNDIPIMTIAIDNTRTSPRPVRWNMPWVITDASILGFTGIIASFIFLWFTWSHLNLSHDQLQTALFLKLLVAGHMTIYVTRSRGWFWQKPLPNWKLFVALETTQVIGTLVAIFGWLIEPISWQLALGIWGYAIIWLFLTSGVRVLALRLFRPYFESKRKKEIEQERSRKTKDEAKEKE